MTAWELVREGIPVTLLADGAAAALMREDKVRWAIVGADRIAANGDVANKIGTYHLAVAAAPDGAKIARLMAERVNMGSAGATGTRRS